MTVAQTQVGRVNALDAHGPGHREVHSETDHGVRRIARAASGRPGRVPTACWPWSSHTRGQYAGMWPSRSRIAEEISRVVDRRAVRRLIARSSRDDSVEVTGRYFEPANRSNGPFVFRLVTRDATD